MQHPLLRDSLMTTYTPPPLYPWSSSKCGVAMRALILKTPRSLYAYRIHLKTCLIQVHVALTNGFSRPLSFASDIRQYERSYPNCRYPVSEYIIHTSPAVRKCKSTFGTWCSQALMYASLDISIRRLYESVSLESKQMPRLLGYYKH